MIGTKYTSEMLAAFAKLPRLCRMDVFISFYENATSDDPWLRICEPSGERRK